MKATCNGLLILLFCLSAAAFAIDPIQRKVPPPGIEIPASIQAATRQRLAQLAKRFEPIKQDVAAADIEVLLKAVELALQHDEIYKEPHFALLGETLDLAEQRIARLMSNQPDWTRDHLTVRGFYSKIDDSAQPYGLVIPEDLPADKPVPLYVWLHGRGDKTTDIHFIKDRRDKVGQISPPGAIVLHPFGRQCIGFKSAGETDVLEAIDHVKANYNIDDSRIVLMGFSMGGAGAWHLGAHYTDHFVAVSPGAGFAETAKYQKLTAEQIAAIPPYEQTLWGAYDVPGYVRNLFNVPIVCYSGEKDKQIQAARVMEAAFQANGRTIEHIIGPEMGHRYDEASLTTIMDRMATAVQRGNQRPEVVHLQTRTLRYSKMHWLQISRLKRHWEDTTVDAEINDDTVLITAKNVAELTIHPPRRIKRAIINDTVIQVASLPATFSKTDQWKLGAFETSWPIAKKPGLQGPIDDAFLDRFLVVTPTTSSSNKQLNAWVEFELEHLRSRWAALFRAKLPEKSADEVTEKDWLSSHLIVFGDAESNPVLNEAMGPMPLTWTTGVLQLAREKFNGEQYVPVMIYPNPLNPAKYIVINSGPTFREAHDRTNSLQNPKLPDWAILDISTPPNAEAAGKVIRAGFFDENWHP